MLGWYADVAVDARYEVKTFRLTHVVCEDVGLAPGATVAAALRDRLADGIDSNGAAHGVMDESAAFSQVSFEGRSNHRIERHDAGLLEHVEDMLAVDLVAFFEGFAQGARATVHLRLEPGSTDPHHAWEAAFRAFARAVRAALAPNPRRAGRTAGVKGTLD
jgi:imidazoleglycerol-phosphate dehydratase